jgi:hypothetical protein
LSKDEVLLPYVNSPMKSLFTHAQRSRPLLTLALLLPAGLAVASEDAEGTKFFEMKIRPLLAQKCFDCHGKDKQKGDLRLDHIDHIRAGGSHYGPALVAGPPDKSPLILAVSYTDSDLEMPPEEKLTSAEIDLLRKVGRDGCPLAGRRGR